MTPLPETNFFLSRSSYPLGGTIVGTILIRPQKKNDDDEDEDDDDDDDLRSVLESVTVFVAGYNKIDPRWHDPTEYTCKLYGPVHPLIQNIQTTKGFDPELLGIQHDINRSDGGGGGAGGTGNQPNNNNNNSGVVCFWATDGLECLELTERSEGTWRDWTSTVVSTDSDDEESGSDSGEEEDDDVDDSDESDGEVDDDDEEDQEEELSSQAGSNEDSSEGNEESDVTNSSSNTRTQNQRRKNLLAFTFRVDIPHDLPPSMHGTTCRYYYTAHVLVKTETQQQVLKRSFQVTTHPHHHHQLPQSSSATTATTTGRVKFGTCQGMAHSIGLPCHVSSMDIHRPIGQISVQPPFDVRRDRSDIQTIRVCTTSSSTPSLPVCLLTIVGSQHLTPNGRLQLQWDFPSTRKGRGLMETSDNAHSSSSSSSFAPCYQIAACLKGEEMAVYEDGTTKRTQTLLFDTCHEYVVPDVTQSVTKTLWLDGNMTSGDRTPCQITSDIMSLKVWCQVDITIIDVDATKIFPNTPTSNHTSGDATDRSDDPQDSTTASQSVTPEVLMKPNYSNLSLEIPVRICHYLENEDEVMEQQENRVKPLKELLGLDKSATSTKDNHHGNDDDEVFGTDDILSDLKTLSLKVEELVRIDGDRGWIS